VNAEFEQFTSDSLRSPKAILRRDTSNERDHIACDAQPREQNQKATLVSPGLGVASSRAQQR
jgi:hypothetical protein